jgi:hypothetical protein
MSVCPTCRAHLEPALPLCVACGRLFPEQEPAARGLVVRRPPDDPRSRTEVQQLLAAASGQPERTVARYLEKGRALFRLPASEGIARRLHAHLTEAGAEVELEASVNTDVEWSTWARAAWSEKAPLVLLWLGAGVLGASRRPNLLLLWMITSAALALLDLRGFGRRISLSPAVLARRLGLVSGTLARPAAALFRRARSQELRAALGAALVEHARLLSAVAHALRGHPALQVPFRESLDEVGEHTLRVAENAVTIEEVGDPEDAALPERLAGLRALGSDETDRQLKALLLSRDERQARHEWLREAHALLLVRLEAITERLRGLRQETAARALEASAGDAAAADQALKSLGHEMELASSALAEVERDLPRALPEVIAEVIAPRRG